MYSNICLFNYLYVLKNKKSFKLVNPSFEDFFIFDRRKNIFCKNFIWIYQNTRDLFTTAIDYDDSSKEKVEFFQTIQNKFHYAIVSMASPELILNRANSYNKTALWMQSYQKNNITMFETKIWKNYLLEDQLGKAIFTL